MSIRDAILKAAAHIKRHPKEFRFMSISVPGGEGCGTPGCASGWINFFQGSASPIINARVLGVATDGEFYRRMDSTTIWNHFIPGLWEMSARACARSLRLYADKYHPAPVAVRPVSQECRVIAETAPEPVGSWDLCPWKPRTVTATP
jgi:hypothetical protein